MSVFPGGRELDVRQGDPDLAATPTATAVGLPFPLDTLVQRGKMLTADPARWGFVGSLFLAIAAISIGITPKPDPVSGIGVLGWLRTTMIGQAIGTSLVVIGVAILLHVWFTIGRDLRAGIGLTQQQLVRAFWLWSLPLIVTPPMFSRDLYSYAAQATMARLGMDTYALGPSALSGPFADSVDPLWVTTPAPYGPLFLWLSSLVTHVTTSSVFLTVIGMRLIALGGIWLIVRYLPRLAQHCKVSPVGALWMGLANPLTLMHFVSGGHNDALMIGLCLMGLVLALEQRYVLASATLALSAGVKATAAVVLAVVGMSWAKDLYRRSFPTNAGHSPKVAARDVPRKFLLIGFTLTGLTALATFVAVTLATGYGFGWVNALGVPGTVKTWLSPPTAIGMMADGLGDYLGIQGWGLNFVALARQAAMVVTLGVFIWLFWQRRTLDPVRGAAFALFIVAALGPVLQPWYLMWALVPLAAGGIRARRWTIAGKPRTWATEANIVMWGVVALTGYSQLNGSTMLGPFGIPGTLACVFATLAVISQARRREHQVFGPDAVFDLAIIRRHPHGHRCPAREPLNLL